MIPKPRKSAPGLADYLDDLAVNLQNNSLLTLTLPQLKSLNLWSFFCSSSACHTQKAKENLGLVFTTPVGNTYKEGKKVFKNTSQTNWNHYNYLSETFPCQCWCNLKVKKWICDHQLSSGGSTDKVMDLGCFSSMKGRKW